MNKTAELLSFDPFAAAEQMTGCEYKDDEGTSALGMLLTMAHGERKNAHLMELDDTVLSNNLDRYIRIVTEMGFEQVLKLPFSGKLFGDDEPRNEHHFIFAHRHRGLLLAFDTFGGDRVNGGKVYYCWRPDDGDVSNAYRFTSSGSWCDFDSSNCYWFGDHDCREALRFKLQRLADNGTFLQRWPEDNKRFLWLLHYMDSKQDGYDYKAITEERIAMLPRWVQEMIGR